MKGLRILIVAILLPFALYGAKKQDLPYNYIDNSTPNITKELAEQRHKKGLGERLENAESSGFMLGIGGGMIYPINLNNYSVRDIGGVWRYNGKNYLVNEQYKIDSIKASSNLLLGYKWFSNSVNSYWFGIRYYVDYNARFLDIVMSHSVGLNVDFLFNIVNKKPFNFGLFFGGGIGGAIEQANQKYCFLDKCNSTFAGIAGNVNFGFRFVIANNSAIELWVQCLLFQDMKDELREKFYDSSYENYTSIVLYQPSKNADTLIATSLRFIYTF